MSGVNHPLDFTPTGTFSPPKTPFSGVHFSDSEIPGGVLHGARRGSSPQASDAHRVHVGRGAPGGVHVYRRGASGHPAISSRKHAYGVSGEMAIADISGDPVARKVFGDALTAAYKDAVAAGADPQTAKFAAQNAAEHALMGAGWDGYEASGSQPGSVFLFGDQRVDGAAQST